MTQGVNLVNNSQALFLLHLTVTTQMGCAFRGAEGSVSDYVWSAVLHVQVIDPTGRNT